MLQMISSSAWRLLARWFLVARKHSSLNAALATDTFQTSCSVSVEEVQIPYGVTVTPYIYKGWTTTATKEKLLVSESRQLANYRLIKLLSVHAKLLAAQQSSVTLLTGHTIAKKRSEAWIKNGLPLVLSGDGSWRQTVNPLDVFKDASLCESESGHV